MKTFEHKIVVITLINVEAVIEELNEWGQQGWKLVNVRNCEYIFRREHWSKRWYRFKHRTTGHYLAATGNGTTSDINRAWFSSDRALLVGVEGMYPDFEIVESEACKSLNTKLNFLTNKKTLI